MATILDVAKKANVSKSTVSKALNNYPDISEELRKKIKIIADELDYYPNILAKNMSAKETKNIGVLIANIEDSNEADGFIVNIIKGLFEGAKKYEHELTIFTENSNDLKVKSYYQFCMQRKLDGIILLGLKTSDRYFLEVVDSELPTVVIDTNIVGNKTSSISIDNYQASFDAIKHLVEKNHHKIGFIAGHKEAVVTIKRLQGYHDAIKYYNLPNQESLIMNSDFTYDKTFNLVKKYLEDNKDLDAIFSCSDVMAVAFTKAAQELNYKIPEDISVIGFDNTTLGSFVTPSISSIDQNIKYMAITAVKLLIELKTESGKHVNILHKLVDKESVK